MVYYYKCVQVYAVCDCVSTMSFHDCARYKDIMREITKPKKILNSMECYLIYAITYGIVAVFIEAQYTNGSAFIDP